MNIPEPVICRINLLSDTKLLPEAERFIRNFLQENNPMTATQMNGLENIVLAAGNSASIQEYIRHQYAKAAKTANEKWKNRDYYVALFYESLNEKLTALKTFVRQQKDWFPRPDLPGEAEDAVREYHYYLVKEFIQHLVADHNFRATIKT